MGEFNSDDHYIYYSGQEYIRRNGVAHIVNERIRNAVLGCNLKNNRMISVHFQGKPFKITVIQVYAPNSNAEDVKLTVLWRPTRPSRTNTQKRCPFHFKGLECKTRKSRDTWINTQIWPWSTKWSRANANWVLPREHTGHSKHPLPTTQQKTLQMDITRWSYQNQIDYILCSHKLRSSIQSAKTRLGADCGPDHKLLIAKGNNLTIQVWPISNPLQLYSGRDK